MSFGHGDGDWMTPDAIRKLREWWPDRSISSAEIGRRLGISKSAVVGKAHRLDLEARPSPIRRADEPAFTPTAGPVVRVTLPPLASLSPQAPAPRPAIAAPAPRPTPIPSAGDCCWPIAERPYRYCDKPTFGRLPYCEAHAKRSYQSEGWRQRGNVGEPAHASGGDD